MCLYKKVDKKQLNPTFTATPTLQLLQFRVQDFSDGLKIRPPWFHAVFLSARILVNKWQVILLHFVAFFHVASLFSTSVDNKKVGVDNENL